ISVSSVGVRSPRSPLNPPTKRHDTRSDTLMRSPVSTKRRPEDKATMPSFGVVQTALLRLEQTLPVSAASSCANSGCSAVAYGLLTLERNVPSALLGASSAV